MAYGRDRDYNKELTRGDGSALQWVALACVLLLGFAVIYSFFYSSNRNKAQLEQADKDQQFLGVNTEIQPATPVNNDMVVVIEDVPVMRAVPVNPVTTNAADAPPRASEVEVRAATAVAAEPQVPVATAISPATPAATAIPTTPPQPPQFSDDPSVIEIRRAEPVNP